MGQPTQSSAPRSNASIAAGLGVFASLTVSGGSAFAYGEVGYIHTDGSVRRGQSDGTEAEAQIEVICVQSGGVADGATGLFRVAPGPVTGLSGGTAGSLAYLSATAGALTTTPPSTGYSTIVGRWRTSTELIFRPRDSINLG